MKLLVCGFGAEGINFFDGDGTKPSRYTPVVVNSTDTFPVDPASGVGGLVDAAFAPAWWKLGPDGTNVTPTGQCRGNGGIGPILWGSANTGNQCLFADKPNAQVITMTIVPEVFAATVKRMGIIVVGQAPNQSNNLKIYYDAVSGTPALDQTVKVSGYLNNAYCLNPAAFIVPVYPGRKLILQITTNRPGSHLSTYLMTEK